MTQDSGRPRPDSVGSDDAPKGLQELETRLLLSATPLADEQMFELEPIGASQQEVTAAGGAAQTFGIDVSHFQGSINWTSVLNDGIDFVWAKATEGVNFTDSRWVQNVTGAHAAGLLVSGYHFATPYTGGVNDAAAEASDFYNAVSPYLGDGYLRPALDLERGDSLSTTVLSNWVHDFMNAFSSLSGGIVPIIYMNTNYAVNEVNSSVNIYDLWLANWTHNPNNPPGGNADGVWNGYDLWQYSDNTSVAGISGAVDGDVFFGDLGQFSAKYAISTIPDDHGDDLANATSIAVPSTTAGVIGSSADSDWFELTLVSGTDYTFSVLADGLTSAELRLYTGTGTQTDVNTGPAVGSTLAELQFTPIVSGTYYLSVDSSGVGGYDLSVQETDLHGDTIAESSELASVAIGGLQTGDDKDFFHFVATGGMQYDAEVLSVGLPDAVLTLYNSGGAIVSQEIGALPSSPLVHMTWTAPVGGDYYLAVESNSQSLGDYAITLAESDPAIEGDLDGDGFVGIGDLNIVLGNWNQNVTPGDLSLGDPDGDGFVGIGDLNVVLGNWNAGTPPTADADSASQEAVTAQGVATQILGIDVSQFQGTINWTSVANSGREFAFIRAIDRNGNTDTRFLSNIQGSKNAGIWAGAYHFVTPWTDGYNDAVDEATLFANVVGPYLTDGYLRPVIDIEAGPPHSPTPLELDNTVLTNWVHDYMTAFVNLTGVEPLIYTNTNHAVNAFDVGVNVYDLWLANWTNDPNNPPGGNADGVWNGYDFWQYSGGGDTVPGISGGVDGDVYFGSVAEMVAQYGIVAGFDDHGDNFTESTPVTLPSTTTGDIEILLDTDWFSVSLQASTDYTFSVLGGTLASAELSLYSSTGTLIASSTGPASGGALAELIFTPIVGDTYHLEVKPQGSVGTYDLSVQETDLHGDTIAESSELASVAIGGLQTGDDKDFFHFVATGGMQYDAEVLSVGLPDAVLTLYNSGGAIVSQEIGALPSSPLVHMTWTAPVGGDYYLAVESNSQSLGDYAITLAESDPAIEGDLDGDGFVGIGDLNIVLGNWNQNVTPGDLSLGDPDGDGFVGIGDLNVVLGNWNAGTPPTADADSASQPAVSAAAVSKSSSSSDSHMGLAIVNWSGETRSAFGDDDESSLAPAIGLWEENATA